MAKVSIIIPSYKCQYASRTVDDIIEKATGDIEVIVLLDNYWPDPPLKDYPNLIVVHKGMATGMRDSINKGVEIAKGKYIMKSDDHCMFCKGFDELMQKDMQSDWLAIPSRFSLDPVNWGVKRGATEYEFMAYPYASDTGIGLYSKKFKGDDGFGKNNGYHEWYKKEDSRKAIRVDDIMIFQGSCWFMEKSHFIKIGRLFNYKTMYNEPQELTFKTWLSGGRCVVNKNAWYAHMFKTSDKLLDDPQRREYYLNLTEMRRTERFGNWYWMTDQWPGATKKMKWLVDKFWPIPGWPENWEEERDRFYKEHPMIITEGEA
jgi:glycosyltransferase involved in cell wall biosynthesis